MLKEAAKELTLLDFDSKLPIGEIQSNNTATPAPVKDVGSPDGSINLEQVNQAFFGARFWISRARIRQAVTPVELMALVIEYHHHGDKNEFVIETYQALRNAIKKGFLAARSDSMMPLPSLPANDEWIVTVHDAEQFFQSIGLGWSVTKAIEDVFNECVPKATEPQAGTAPVQSTATPAPVGDDEVDFTIVATRKELIDAFGGITKMDMTWFDNLTDAPKLKAARKFKGQGGRNSAEPLFCPFEVLQWLVDPQRRKGKPINDTTAWRLLKGHFLKVYNQHSIGDPNAD